MIDTGLEAQYLAPKILLTSALDVNLTFTSSNLTNKMPRKMSSNPFSFCFFYHVVCDLRTAVSEGSSDGAVVRALASHQCGPGSTPGPGVICGLSLLVVLVLAPRGFSPGTLVFPSPQKPTLPNSNLIWSVRDAFKRGLKNS